MFQVFPGKGDAFDVKIVDRQVERYTTGKLDRRTLTEMWPWAAEEQQCVKRSLFRSGRPSTSCDLLPGVAAASACGFCHSAF